MTIKKLNQLWFLNRLIERDRMEIQRIEESLGVKSPSLTGMPHIPGAHDKLGEGIPELVDRKAELGERLQQYTKARNELREYIETVPDLHVRLVMQLRFLDMLSWQDVADRVGGNNSEDSCRMLVKRYLRKTEKEEAE